jgi:hypothetical protein
VIPTLQTRLSLALHRGRGAFRQAATSRHERPHLARFREFHARLPTSRDAIYMFFTGNLLHWLDRALRFVPDEVNLVLVGSDLSPEEIAWIAARTPRPFHHVETRVDDNTVLDFIFATARHNFGWLHVDCFVLNPELFGEMTTLGDDVVANCIWSHPGTNGDVRALHSAFVFMSQRALSAVREAGIDVSACAYHYEGSAIGRTPGKHPLYSRVPTARQVELLGKVLPRDQRGLPEYPQKGQYFQVLVLYQLVAQALGYRLCHVRDLMRDGSASAAHYSNEIVHVNGVATYKSYKEADKTLGNRFYPLLLQADYAMLSTMSAPPDSYLRLREELSRELRRLGLPESAVRSNLQSFLSERGISDERCALILG